MRPEEAIGITAVDHFVLRARDLDRALAFYHSLLRLPVEFLEEHRAGLRPFVSLRAGTTLIDLVPDPTYDAETGGRSGGLLHFCLRVTGRLVDDVLPKLRAAGVEVLEDAPAERMGATGSAPSIYVRDPDGYVVELKEETSG